MLKRACLAALFLLLGTGARPASAQLFDPYFSVYSARTVLPSPTDDRPKDAFVGTPSRKENPEHRFVAAPYFSRSDPRGPGSNWTAAIFLGYAGLAGPSHPWSVAASYSNTRLDMPGPDTDQGQWSAEGKFTVWQPRNRNLPVVTVVADFYHTNGSGEFSDVLLAADQRLCDRAFFTANVGFAHWAPFGAGGTTSALQTGVGLTYRVSNRLSVSPAYTPESAVLGDFWSLNAIYALGRSSVLWFGGGKDETFYVQYGHRFD